MLEQSIRVRDRHQFEIVLAYPLAPDATVSHCMVETYMFLPRALGTDRGTYRHEDFYRDLQVYTRLKTPSVPLADIAGHEGVVAGLLQRYTGQAGVDDTARFEREAKLFCCILRSALRDTVSRIVQSQDNVERSRLTAQYVEDLSGIVDGYRRFRTRFQNVPDPVLNVFALTDEYMSLLVEEFSFELLETLTASGREISSDTRSRLLAVISHEAGYRTEQGYPSVARRDDDNETVLYRRGVLKKFAHSVLYLKTQQSKEGRLLEQAVFGFSAGVAMLLATAVAFASTVYYGAISIPVFTALVVSYIFKDRIKELLRIYLSRKLSSRIFDHRTRIQTHAGRKVGVFKESFEFIDEHKTPQEILRVRNRGRQALIDNPEFGPAGDRVIFYRRWFRFRCTAIAKIFEGHDVSGVNDIMRFSIAEIARNAGRPRKRLYVVDGDSYSRVPGERVHHLNLVVKFALNQTSTYRHYRVVFNSRKIKRIETISTEDCLF